MPNYNDILTYLVNSLPMYQRVGDAAYKADLENSYKLDRYLKHPHRSFRSVHIAGTNGKGSVSHMLASVFHCAGYRTGLYTSPHLLDFRERIRVNGEMISKEYIVEFVKKHQAYFDQNEFSFFEMTVFMAFSYFKHLKVDIAVIEVGMGGRLDSTNVISPLVSVITNIGFDHTRFLGNTKREIAGEKAGIIKPNTPVVIGETDEETRSVFKTFADRKASSITFADSAFEIDYGMKNLDNTISYYLRKPNELELDQVDTDLKGEYQKKNICTSLETIQVLNKSGIKISKDNILTGMKKVTQHSKLRGRWQEISYDPLVVCDSAHNTDGITQVVTQIRNTPHKNLHLVLGFVNDKDIASMLGLFPVKALYYFAPLSIERSWNVRQIQDGQMSESIYDAYRLARENAGPDDMIFVGGSSFAVADFLAKEKK